MTGNMQNFQFPIRPEAKRFPAFQANIYGDTGFTELSHPIGRFRADPEPMISIELVVALFDQPFDILNHWQIEIVCHQECMRRKALQCLVSAQMIPIRMAYQSEMQPPKVEADGFKIGGDDFFNAGIQPSVKEQYLFPDEQVLVDNPLPHRRADAVDIGKDFHGSAPFTGQVKKTLRQLFTV
jgi:hypothetical protein